jgi:hypothetical protein
LLTGVGDVLAGIELGSRGEFGQIAAIRQARQNERATKEAEKRAKQLTQELGAHLETLSKNPEQGFLDFGATLLKFGQTDEAIDLFKHVDEMRGDAELAARTNLAVAEITKAETPAEAITSLARIAGSDEKLMDRGLRMIKMLAPETRGVSIDQLRSMVVLNDATDKSTGEIDIEKVRQGIQQQDQQRGGLKGERTRAFDAFLDDARKRNPGISRADAAVEALRRITESLGERSEKRAAAQVRGRTAEEGTSEFLELQEEKGRRQATGRAAGSPLPAEIGRRVAALDDSLDVVNQLTTEFTRSELEKFSGFIENPSRQLLQAFSADPKFARFQVLINRAKLAAFSEGGKQLTPFEASVVFGYVPTGLEFSVEDFLAKLSDAKQRIPTIRDRLLSVQATPRGELKQETAKPKLSPQGQKFLEKLKR